jgi:hypothetical protein
MTDEIEYDAYTQNWINSYERLKAQRKANPDSVSRKELEETRATVERLKENERLRAERWAKLDEERQAKAQAEAEAAEQQRQKTFQAELAAFKERARLNFPGTAAEFEAQWGQIKAEWQRRRALGGDDEIDRVRKELRESGRYQF